MNVIDIIDALEDVVLEGQLPLVKWKSVINVDEVLDMLDEIKKQLPKELQAANHLRAEKNKLIIEAQQEAQTLIEDVAREADKMLDESDITQNAYIKSKQILNQTHDDMEELKNGTYKYLANKMDELCDKLTKMKEEINESREELKSFLVQDDD